MKIAIDYRFAMTSNRGMARYCREIVKKLFSLDKENNYLLYITEIDKSHPDIPSNFCFIKIASSNEILSEQCSIAVRTWIDKPDILWCPYNTFPFLTYPKTHIFLTIHDLIFLHAPLGTETFRQWIGRYYRKITVSFSRFRIFQVFTVSRFSKEEIIKKLKIKNVKITYNSIESFYKLRMKFKSIPRDANFFFTVSGDAPSKNLNFLISFFENNPQWGQLYIAGVTNYSQLRQRESECIHFLPAGISDIDLYNYYARCKAFLFLSFEEGFGLPVLEALTCNAPAIVSNRTSLPEILGECGILIDPTSTDALQDALCRIQNIVVDTKKIEKHLSQFISWQCSAQTILNSINNKDS